MGKQKCSEERRYWFFSWSPSEIVKYFFPEVLLWNFGKNWKDSVCEDTGCPAYYCSRYWIQCYQRCKEHAQVSRVHCPGIFSSNKSLLCSSVISSRLSICAVHEPCGGVVNVSQHATIQICFQLANFSLLCWNVNKRRAFTCLRVRCCSVSGIRCLVLFKLSNLCLFISRSWNTWQYCL